MLAILDTGAKFQLAQGYARGMKYFHLTIKSKRQLKKAVKRLHSLDIGTVIPVGIDLPDGLRLPEESPKKLIHIAAGQACVMGQSALITAPRMSKEVERVFNTILPYTRNLSLSCGHDTARAARYILKFYGIPALPPLQEHADLTVDLMDFTVNDRPLKGASFTLKNAPEPPHGADKTLWNYALLESGLFEPLTIIRA